MTAQVRCEAPHRMRYPPACRYMRGVVLDVSEQTQHCYRCIASVRTNARAFACAVDVRRAVNGPVHKRGVRAISGNIAQRSVF